MFPTSRVRVSRRHHKLYWGWTRRKPWVSSQACQTWDKVMSQTAQSLQIFPLLLRSILFDSTTCVCALWCMLSWLRARVCVCVKYMYECIGCVFSAVLPRTASTGSFTVISIVVFIIIIYFFHPWPTMFWVWGNLWKGCPKMTGVLFSPWGKWREGVLLVMTSLVGSLTGYRISCQNGTISWQCCACDTFAGAHCMAAIAWNTFHLAARASLWQWTGNLDGAVWCKLLVTSWTAILWGFRQ